MALNKNSSDCPAAYSDEHQPAHAIAAGFAAAQGHSHEGGHMGNPQSGRTEGHSHINSAGIPDPAQGSSGTWDKGGK